MGICYSLNMDDDQWWCNDDICMSPSQSYWWNNQKIYNLNQKETKYNEKYKKSWLP